MFLKQSLPTCDFTYIYFQPGCRNDANVGHMVSALSQLRADGNHMAVSGLAGSCFLLSDNSQRQITGNDGKYSIVYKYIYI